jgi:cobalt-zinc-cadmium efflux system outer membrane protein
MPSRAPLCAGLAACAVSLIVSSSAHAQRTQEVVDLILREGPRAVAIRAEVEVVRREQAARRSWPNPSIAYSRETAGFTEFLQVEQALPIFGIRSALAKAGVTAIAAAEAEGDARLWALRAEALSALAQLLAAESRVAVAETEAGRVGQLIETLRIREREGEGSRFDRVRAEHELADARRDLGDARVAVAEARAVLAGLLPPNTPLPAVVEPLFTSRPVPDEGAVVAQAATTRADLRALRLAIDGAREEAAVAVRQRAPQPVVTGGLKRADNNGERQRGSLIGLGVTIPLFDTGRSHAARWDAEARQAEAERMAIEQRVRAEVATAAAVLKMRQETLPTAASTGVEDDLVTMADVAYREGDIGIVTLLDALRTSARSQIRDIDMQLEARLAQVALERAVGGVVWP